MITTLTNTKKRKRMKTIFIRNIASLAICALLLPAAANAQTTAFTALGQVLAVPSPGIVCTNALGQVLVRGIIHTEREQASDPRVTGQVLSIGDGAFNADGSANLQGAGHFQVGTWDATGTNFIPSGGVWEATWRGVIQADFSGVYSIVGYGVGGTIDGWHLEQTLTVTNAHVPFDGTYLYAGSIKPPPRTTTTKLALNNYAATWEGKGDLIADYDPTSQQLTLGGSWASPTMHLVDTCAGAGWAFPWTVPNGQTLETRVNLVNVSPATTLAMVELFHSNTEVYDFEKGDGWIVIEKWHAPIHTCLYAEKVAIPNTNVVMVLALTRVDQNLILTGKLLDSQSGAVLYEKSVVDTPASDPSLTAAQLAQITGLREWPDYGDDPAGAPWTSGANGPALSVAQDTDATKPPATATFANFELRTYEVPQVSIARAAQLSFPAPAGVHYTVEAAPTVQGPYLPVQELDIPGIQKQTVPFSGPAQFFRLIQAP
jgi:hypothetical protein